MSVIELTPDTIQQMREKKLLREAKENIEIELAQKPAGAKVVGQLNLEEIEILAEITRIDNDIENMNRSFMVRLHRTIADNLVEDNQDNLRDYFSVISEQEAYEATELSFRRDYLFNHLMYNLYKRLDKFAYQLGIFEDGDVVELGQRWLDAESDA